jgi:hypothetical protein
MRVVERSIVMKKLFLLSQSLYTVPILSHLLTVSLIGSVTVLLLQDIARRRAIMETKQNRN